MIRIQKTDLFDAWFRHLKDLRAQGKILARLKRIELGSFGDHKSVGAGVFEMRIDCGPGYRIYYSRVKNSIVILLVGGDKSSQAKDIQKAKQILTELGD